MAQRGRRQFLAGMGLVALLSWPAAAAQAAETSVDYTANAVIADNGDLAVRAVIEFNGAPTAVFRQEFATRDLTDDRREYLFALSGIAATTAGRTLPVNITTAANSTIIEIPTDNLPGPVELTYLVGGAAHATADDTTTVTWPLLQGTNVPVARFDAEIEVPGQFTMIDCAAGDPASPGACTYYGGGTHNSPRPSFHQEGSAAGDVVITAVRFPRSVVAVNEDLRELWSLDRAFSTGPLPLGLAAGLLVLGGLGLWAAHSRIGRDAGGQVAPRLVAEFHPVGPGQSEFRVLDDVRPGEVGTLADERVDPVDITATLLDLAVREHLLITELPRDNRHAPTDWTFARRANPDGELLAYERTLLNAVAPTQGEPVKASNLAGAVGSVIGQIQSELYDEVVQRGWFSRRPDATRNRWGLLGWVGLAVAVVLTGLLAWLTSFGLVGLVLIMLMLGLLFVAQEMPARTADGSAVLGGLAALRASLLTQPVDQLPAGGGADQVSALLPYAIVLGGWDRWLQAVVAADDDTDADATDLAWYHGPDDWHLSDLPASLANLITTVQGTLFSR